jgi:hypothetical protein
MRPERNEICNSAGHMIEKRLETMAPIRLTWRGIQNEYHHIRIRMASPLTARPIKELSGQGQSTFTQPF